MPFSVSERFLGELPNASLVAIERCGHTAMFDQPESVTQHVLQFIGAHDAPG